MRCGRVVRADRLTSAARTSQFRDVDITRRFGDGVVQPLAIGRKVTTERRPARIVEPHQERRRASVHWNRPQAAGALVVVTHDRWFLDEVCTTTWEVHDGIVEPFEGGYAAYVLQRVERDRMAAASEAKRQNLMRKELAWLRRGAPARTSHRTRSAGSSRASPRELDADDARSVW